MTRYLPAVLLAVLVLALPDTALAFGNAEIIGAGTGLGGTFDTKLREIAGGIVTAMNIVLIMMTVISGMMITFGLEDGKKFMWQVMLGAGLAVNFGAFMFDVGFWDFADKYAATTNAVTYFQPELAKTSSEWNILGKFMDNYTQHIITPGAANILPYCLKLLVVLAIIQATWEITMKFASGDKIQYMIQMTLKTGFYMFLMVNWISLMGALSDGFEMLGYKAGGNNAASASNIVGNNCDQIVKFSIDMVNAIWGEASFASLGILLISVCGLVAIVYCLFMTALEMFMARIEFYTMALLTIPLLAFGVTEKFAFLTEKAIGAMFNLAIKICVIAFISSMAVPFIESFTKDFQSSKGFGSDVAIILQAILACAIIYFLTKKIPALVTGLLSGSPQLGGSSMVDMARGAGGTVASAGRAAVTGGAALAGQYAAAKTAATAKGQEGLRGTLTQLGRNYAYSRSPVQAYRGAIKSFHETLKDTGSALQRDIRETIDKQKKSAAGGTGSSGGGTGAPAGNPGGSAAGSGASPAPPMNSGSGGGTGGGANPAPSGNPGSGAAGGGASPTPPGNPGSGGAAGTSGGGANTSSGNQGNSGSTP